MIGETTCFTVFWWPRKPLAAGAFWSCTQPASKRRKHVAPCVSMGLSVYTISKAAKLRQKLNLLYCFGDYKNHSLALRACIVRNLSIFNDLSNFYRASGTYLIQKPRCLENRGLRENRASCSLVNKFRSKAAIRMNYLGLKYAALTQEMSYRIYLFGIS